MKLWMQAAATLFVGSVIAISPARSQNFDNVISFGDSLSDTGNVFAFIGEPPPPYFQGRFSNGPVWTELLAGGAGSMNSPFQGTGVTGNVNLAFGGARTDLLANLNNVAQIPGAGFLSFPGATTLPINLPPGIPSQIDAYLALGGAFRTV